MTAIDDLIERVESGEGADRELDAAVFCAVCRWTAHEVFGMAGNTFTQYRDEGTLVSTPHPVTTSLDAVVALIGQKLPGADWKMHAGAGSAHVTIGQQSSYARTPSRALLAATLRAIKEQSHG